VLWERSVVEQRYDAVREVLDGRGVTEVAARYGVSRQPHFELEVDAPAAYATFQAAFARDVPTLDAASLIRACR
jgi:hypothetical protein